MPRRGHSKKRRAARRPPPSPEPPPERADGSPRGRRRAWWLLLVVLLLGAGVRVAYLAEIRRAPDFAFPGRDALYHDYWARALVSGDWTPPPGKPDPEIRTSPYLRPPGYPFFLAGVYLLTGSSYLGARIVQMLLGLASALLAFLLGRRLFGEAAGLLAAAFLSFYWIFPYYEGELHAPVVAVFLVLALANLLHLWALSRRARVALAAGLCLGAFVLVRPNALLVVPVALAWVAWVARRHGARALPAAAALLAGTVALVAPVTLRNALVTGDPVLVSSNAGINLYLAHNPQADGVSSRLPEITRLSGRSGWTCFDYPEIARGVERIAGRPMDPSGVSDYFARRALAFIRADPLRALRWAFGRAVLFWGPAEVSNDEVVAYDRAYSPVLSHLPGGFSLVLTLALLGGALLVAEARVAGRAGAESRLAPADIEVAVLLGAFVVTYFLSLLPTIVAARYRVPLLPPLLLFGAYGAARVGGWVRRQELRRAGLWVLAAGLLYFVVSRPYVPYQPDRGAWHFNRAAAAQRQGDLQEAVREYRAALAADPRDADAHSNLGSVLDTLGQREEAIAELRAALALEPDLAVAHNNLGAALLRAGREAEARSELRAALAIDPDYAEAHHNLGLSLAAGGELAAAEEEYRRALAAEPGYLSAEVGLARVLARQGRLAEAIAEFRRVLERRPDDAAVHHDLGTALAQSGDLDAARSELTRAVELDPGASLAENDLGNVYALQGDLAAAAAHFARAVELAPDAPDAHLNLATALRQQGKAAEARRELRQALRLRPGWPRAADDLATLLLAEPGASAEDRAEALELARRACDATGRREPRYLATLAAALAAGGRPGEAAATARRAAALARAAGEEPLARELERRAALYRR